MFATRKSPPTPKTRLAVQALEAREVPYATVTLGSFDGVGYLTITGTSRADEITIQAGSDGYEVSHKSANEATTRVDKFPYALNVQDLFVSAGDGDDTVKNLADLPMTARGQGGNDTIRAAGGKTLMDGGAGSDSLYGGWHEDELIGGDGNDFLYGDNGNDTLRGGADNDRLDGQGDNDKVYGGSGRDQVYGGSGDDWLDPGSYPGSSPDIVDGGVGIDLNARVLVVNGIAMTDVVQGGEPTCWIASAVASVALREPGCLTTAVRYAGEDTFDVTLYAANRTRITQRVTFDGDRLDADLQLSATDAATAEFWQVVWQRAYLTSRGRSTGTPGSGNPTDVLTALTGRAGSRMVPAADTGYLRASAWDALLAGLGAGQNVTAMTWSDDVKDAAGNMKRSTDVLVGWHAYTVLSTFVDAAGEKYVWLRNPWGRDGGRPIGPDDGIVLVTFADFQKSMCEIEFN